MSLFTTFNGIVGSNIPDKWICFLNDSSVLTSRDNGASWQLTGLDIANAENVRQRIHYAPFLDKYIIRGNANADGLPVLVETDGSAKQDTFNDLFDEEVVGVGASATRVFSLFFDRGDNDPREGRAKYSADPLNSWTDVGVIADGKVGIGPGYGAEARSNGANHIVANTNVQGRITYSTDNGSNWTQVDYGTLTNDNNDRSGVAYGNGEWLISEYDEDTYGYSSDGINFSRITITGIGFIRIGYADYDDVRGIWYLIESPESNSRILYTTDISNGASWAFATVPAINFGLADIRTKNGIICACGQGDITNSAIILRSTDGFNFSEVILPALIPTCISIGVDKL